jgi:hypothetical protein
MREAAREDWKTGKGLVLSGTKPDCKVVEAALLQFKVLTPQKV